MPGKHLFEYAIIRIVPRVEREEFLNAGVILYCRDKKFLKALYSVDEKKLDALCAKLDCKEVEEHLRAISWIADGDPRGGPIAQLDPASRFRWLTATRSTIVQSSRVHPGLCDIPEETLQKLHAQLVL
jgi:hypothetical protein